MTALINPLALTGANAVLMVGVTGLFPVMQQIQGFAPEEAFGMPSVKNKEVVIGVDAQVSAGWLPTLKTMNLTIQPNTSSYLFMAAWAAAEEAAQSVYVGFGQVSFPSLGLSFALPAGYLTEYPPMPEVRRMVQPVRFVITWAEAIQSPI